LRRHGVGALEEVRDLAEAVTRRRELRLWDVELAGHGRGSLVRVFVDSDGGVDLDTVAEVSEEISRGLDLRDPIAGRYTLEVSSPGLERSLNRPEHFALSVGRRVVVKTKDPLVGSGQRVDGVIVEADQGGVRLAADDRAGEVVAVPYDAIRSARTVFEWS
jgi:ribosome maturation factor RimP